MRFYATIRGPEGEARFATRADVERALRIGLVSASDEIRLAGEEQWRPLASLVSANRPLWKEHHHWYALGAALLVAWMIGLRFLGLMIIFGSHALWLAVFHRRRGQSIRWW